MHTRDQVDLDQPAFLSEESTENPTAQPSQGESGGREEQVNPVEPTSGGEENPVVTDEQRVPYSRFETAHKARREAEARAAEAEQKLNELLSSNRQEDYSRHQETRSEEPLDSYQGKLWSRWTKLYGDTPQSREAFQVEIDIQKDIREETRRQALDAVRQERDYETQVLSRNEEVIQTRIDDLAVGLGRPLSKKEEDEVLGIVDEWTPKDRNGNYTGEMIPFEKAWEIHELRQQSTQNKSRESRRVPTILTSSRSEGEPSQSDRSPRTKKVSWGSWRDRIPE